MKLKMLHECTTTGALAMTPGPISPIIKKRKKKKYFAEDTFIEDTRSLPHKVKTNTKEIAQDTAQRTSGPPILSPTGKRYGPGKVPVKKYY